MKSWIKRAQKCFHVLLLRDYSLTIKMLVYSGHLVIIPMIAVGYFAYDQSTKVLEEEAQQYSWQIIEQVAKNMEYYFLDFDISLLRILNHPDMNTFLAMEDPEEIKQSGIRRSVQQVLYQAAYSRRDITGITVILDDLQVIDTMGIKTYTSAESLTNEYWYKDVPRNGDSMMISRFVQYQDRKEPVISIVKRLHSPRTLKPIGMIITDVNFNRISEITAMVTMGETGYMSILDSQGHYVYHPDVRALGVKAAFEPLKTILETENGSFVVEGERRKLLTYRYSASLGWTMLTLVPYNELTQGSHVIRRTIFIVTIITLVIAYIIGIGFASSIIRPIKRLQRHMKKVESGEFNEMLDVESKDEIGSLYLGFNRMVFRLKQLLDEIYHTKLKETEMNLRQKEIELHVLQAQVNPHFLYNSLETIRGMALEKDMDDIASMSSALSRLLRYNLKKSAQMIPIKEEFEVCKLYLQIQKYRFEDRLDYEINIPEWALEQRIPKFSLQPIIENCVHHGVDPSIETTLIRISIYIESEGEDNFIIEIEDNGPGIPIQRLQEIRYNLKYKDITQGGSQIGVVNVHRRIEHLCGSDYGLTINSEKLEGTRVMILLPLQQVVI
ncbi:cache domain-containing sensor histidine kinase [Bacillus solitudinis]|uniref:cache domain-containing sensor histidine kinase n=1 Tax=Bacillus solitudinis TaxID=2014074 RepID=UPI0018E207A0|nr:sensor histidine kinase [Bacillus solitudinis]